MENLEFTIKECSVVVINIDKDGEYVAHMEVSAVEDEENSRVLNLIASVDVDEKYQHKGIYTKMLKMYAEAFFTEKSYFCSIGRSFEAGNFWAKTLNLSIEETEANEEKDQQERALIIDENLNLCSNEYSPDLFDLFW